jgi:hypothetical protein
MQCCPKRRATERLIFPELFEHEVHGMGVCKRVQVPLKLAWALTVRITAQLALGARGMRHTACAVAHS